MPSLLPNAKAQFVDANGLPLVGGTVGYYSPSTLNPLPTYQDQAGTIANTNPISLDSRGQAIIWGSGVFRQIVKDINGVTIWDQIVASADSAFSASTGASLVGFDGTNLANQFLSRVNRVVDSIAALRSLSKATYTRAFVTGYYAPHDGGGGAYQYDPADTTTADNSGTVIVATDGGRWKLMHNGTVSVCQFGARGTSAVGALVDDTAAFRSAVATGLTIHIPKPTTYFRLTDMVTLTAPSQEIYGDGDNSLVQVDSAFNMSALGVFAAGSIQPAPRFREFKITCVQPDTATRASLVNYPAAIYAQGQPRVQFIGMKITLFINAIDIRGNSGGAVIDNCSISAFGNSILIDGALDSVKIQTSHLWPFDMTANQLSIYSSLGAVGVNSGRCDDLHIDDCLIFSYQGIITFPGASGSTFGCVTSCDFDTNSNITLTSGELRFVGCGFSTAGAGRQWVTLTNGAVGKFDACEFLVGTVDSTTLIQVTGAAGALAEFNNCRLSTGSSDQTMCNVSGSGTGAGTDTAVFNNCFFVKTPGINYVASVILQGANGRVHFTNNRALDSGAGSGSLVSIGADDFHVISNNALMGYGLQLPTTYVNLKCDNNIGGAGGDLQSSYVIGNLRTKVFYGTATAGGTWTFPHLIAAAHQKVISCQGFYRNAGGGAAPLVVSSIDGTNAVFSGATASASVRATITYTETQQGW